MPFIRNNTLRTALVLGYAVFPSQGHALSCMVVGEKTAKVQSEQGEKSPMFLSSACESLRLISGKAMVSWISRDGKPNFSPIDARGVSKLPGVGSEERSSKVVWSEMTSTRELARPAFMRALDEERPARLYIPSEGLIFPSADGDQIVVKLIQDQQETVVLQRKSDDTQPLRLTRDRFAPDAVFVVELEGSKGKERWPLRRISDQETSQIETQLAAIQSSDIDESQRQALRAMLYEQLKLRVNMSLALQTAASAEPIKP